MSNPLIPEEPLIPPRKWLAIWSTVGVGVAIAAIDSPFRGLNAFLRGTGPLTLILLTGLTTNLSGEAIPEDVAERLGWLALVGWIGFELYGLLF